MSGALLVGDDVGRESFKAVRPLLGQILHTVQQSPNYVAQLLAVCTPLQQSQLIPSLTHCLYGSYSADERYGFFSFRCVSCMRG